MTTGFAIEQVSEICEEATLPTGWAPATVGDTGQFVNGLAFKESDWSSAGLPIIRIQNLTNPSKPFNRTTRIVDPVYIVERGDILVSWSATLDAFVWREEPALLNQHISKVIPDERVVDKRFQYHVLRWAIAQMRESAHVHGSTMKHINRGPFLAFSIPLPPIPEQRRIVDEIETQFTRLDAAVVALERARSNLKRYRAAVLDASVNGPWENASLGEISAIQGGIQKQPKRTPVANIYPFLRVANVHRGRLDLNDVHLIELFPGELERLRLRKGDLLVVEGNGSPREIGRMAVWDGSVSDCVHQNHLIRIRLGDGLVPEFVEAYWNSPVGQRKVQAVASSTSGLYTLSVRKIERLLVPVPPIDEQHRIVQEVDRRLSIADDIEVTIYTNLKRAERMRQSILRKAFAGQLVPQDPSDEPASKLLERIRAARNASASVNKSEPKARRSTPKSAEVQPVLF
jgi:type I restriction enzyme, S subunit